MTFARLFHPNRIQQPTSKNIKRQQVSIRKKLKSTPRTRQDPIHYHNRKLAELKAKGEDELPFLLTTAHALNAYMNATNTEDRDNTSMLYFEKACMNHMDFTVPAPQHTMMSKNDVKNDLTTYTCPECKIEWENEDVCLECGLQMNRHPQILIGYNERKDYITSETVNYDDIKSVNEFLREIQGIQKASIPDDISNQMQLVFSHYVDQMPNRTLESMTAKDLYTCLKQEKKYAAYYRYIPTLLSRFTGRPKRTLSSQSLSEIQSMAMKVLAVYKQVKDIVCPERHAFFHTKYITYRLLEYVGENEFLPFIRLIKCPNKLKVQDDMWNEALKIIQQSTKI